MTSFLASGFDEIGVLVRKGAIRRGASKLPCFFLESIMHLSRRQVLKAATLTGAGLALSGCERITSKVAGRLGQAVPGSITVADGKEIDPAFHLLSRAGFGPWPGDLDRLHGMGLNAWIEDQLNPGLIDDTACDLRARRFETLELEPGTCYEFKKPVLRDEMARHRLLRATYSRRQLYEVMVEFWSDHFNIYLDKGDCIYLKPLDERLVIRAHALGRFRDLVRASATSPAMLVYLDGKENKKAAPDDKPNENYARELLELHTLGVDGGYSQRDVSEVARCLTGWRLRTKWRRGTVYFDPALHDVASKTVLGQVIRGPGEQELDAVIDLAVSHPSTARHIATKLARHFVADAPPRALVDRVAAEFTATNGDIKSLVRIILASDDFKVAPGVRFKRPFRYMVSALRSVGADTYGHEPLIGYLGRMGNAPFEHPAPDGYPDSPEPWLGTLLWRWNFAAALATGKIGSAAVSIDQLVAAVGGSTPDRLLPHFVGRRGTGEEIRALQAFSDSLRAQGEDRAQGGDAVDIVGLILASPAFQMY
jgi:uncharacterized protein (DUF1800 family)